MISYVEVFDNGGYTNDRYSINVELEDGGRYLITSNEVASIWDVSEGWIVKDELTDEDVHIGDEILWEDLPEGLRNTINNYFWLIDLGK